MSSNGYAGWLARLKAAADHEVFDVLGEQAPPEQALQRVQIREAVVSVLKGKVSGPAAVADAWLGANGDSPAEQQSIASQIIAAGKNAGLELFHDDSRRGFASFERDGHRETYSLRSRDFKLYLRQVYYEATGKSANAAAIDDARGTLEAEALFTGAERPVHVRIAAEHGCLYIDLGDPAWRCIQISPGGWQLLDSHPVSFIRAGSMLALPEPERGGSISRLKPYLNVSEEGWMLVVGFLVNAFRPGFPFPVMQFFGEHGAAKSTSAKVCRKLIDPNKSLLRKAPASGDDLLIAAAKSWVMTFENVSHVRAGLSDDLCRLATGGGLSKRALFTDDDEIVIDAIRPVIITSIEEIAARPDLLDRSQLVECLPIAEEDRKPEDEFWDEFDGDAAAILGGLLDVAAQALLEVETVNVQKLPRMADYAKWVTAAEAALGWEPGAFMAAYKANRASSDATAVESSPVGEALCKVADRGKGFQGPMSELLDLVTREVSEDVARSREWPKTPQKLSGYLKRLGPNLRKLGYEVDSAPNPDAGGKNKTYTLRKLNPSSCGEGEEV